MKVALIHDHLAQDGGAEKVLKALADLYPEATIYTLLFEKQQVDKYFENRKVETSIIQRLPGGVKHYKWYMPFMPMAVEFFDLRNYDLVISDASAFAKGVITAPDTPHICYMHSPTRYMWDYTHQYINELKYNKFIKKVISLVMNYLRIWDRAAADRVDFYIANSRAVKKRIMKYYRRESVVIYPPVEVDKFFVSSRQGDYYLVGGRLAPYKRIDIAIEAFKELGWPLRIYGGGEDMGRLKKLAGTAGNITFTGRVSDRELAELYAGCLAYLYPQEEDFGISAVEAMAAGRPVIAYASGGAKETVLEGKTGLFFYEQTPHALVRTLRSFDPRRFNANHIRRHAEQFSAAAFKKNIAAYIEEVDKKYKEQ